MLNVENKVIAITGASSGIGVASAKLLAQHGAKVVLEARRIDKLEKIVEEIRASGGIAEFQSVDVTVGVAASLQENCREATRSFVLPLTIVVAPS
jgi:NADP-dependent 3-hydroxy acid dehydrogenase YdfG